MLNKNTSSVMLESNNAILHCYIYLARFFVFLFFTNCFLVSEIDKKTTCMIDWVSQGSKYESIRDDSAEGGLTSFGNFLRCYLAPLPKDFSF